MEQKMCATLNERYVRQVKYRRYRDALAHLNFSASTVSNFVTFKVEWLILTSSTPHFLRYLGWSGSIGEQRQPDGRIVFTEGLVQVYTEFCNLGTVREAMTARFRTWCHFSSEEIADVINQISGGLREMHVMGGIHRDVKPDNIYVHLCS